MNASFSQSLSQTFSFSQSFSQDDTLLYAASSSSDGRGTCAVSCSGSRAVGGANSSDSDEGGVDGCGSTESIEEYNHRRFSGHILYSAAAVGKGINTRTCLEVQLRID